MQKNIIIMKNSNQGIIHIGLRLALLFFATATRLVGAFQSRCCILPKNNYDNNNSKQRKQFNPRTCLSISQERNNDQPTLHDIHYEKENNNNEVSTTSNSKSRRSFVSQTIFAAIAGTTTTTTTMFSVVEAANAEPSIISSVQGPIQDILAPGHWIGQFIGINSKTVQWTFPNASPDDVSQALVSVLNDLTVEQKAKLYMPNLDITRADSQKVHVRTWTKNEWLDSLDVTLTTSKNNSSSTIAKASFYATGFLPTSIPGAPLLNIGFAWFPFASPGPRGEMLQDFRLRVLESFVSKRLMQSKE